MDDVSRRRFLRGALLVSGAAMFIPTLLRDRLRAESMIAGTGPYGPLRPPDSNGIALPAGFTSRIVATTGSVVGKSGHGWHLAPDGGAVFARPGGGWVYVSNSEIVNGGGVAAIVFDGAGNITDAYPILTGTMRNCAGGATPWGTWLSCEEVLEGHVWECDPFRRSEGVERPAMGTFSHEAAAVDPATGRIYMTEDEPDGRLYRFTPTRPGDLSTGRLEAADVDDHGVVTWRGASAARPDRSGATAPFAGGEGAWISADSLYFTTKHDNRVWRLELSTDRLTVVYWAAEVPDAPLTGVDNIVGHPSGDLFVAEDGGNMEICLIDLSRDPGVVSPFLRIDGHAGSEVTGPAFNPTGNRLYFSSQRGVGGRGIGVTYEVTGPFRARPPDPPPTTTTTTTTTAGPPPATVGRLINGAEASATASRIR